MHIVKFRRMPRGAWLAAVVAAVCLTPASQSTAQPAETPAIASQTLPHFVQRGIPNEFHEALRPLEGNWRVAKQIFIALGTAENPATSDEITATRTWIAGGRHLLDITQGDIGGKSYYRMGVLGFSNIDRRYEFATFDAMNSNSMLYSSDPLDRPGRVIVLSGTFTDQGLLGEPFVGKTVPMRTIIRIDGPDRHEIELRFDAPGGQQDILVDRTVYTRIPG
jgi:hypothetical protein